MHVISKTVRIGVLFLAMTSVGLAQGVTIQWHNDLGAAQKLAAESNRLVLVHFWAPWCAPCMRLEQQVFNQAVVAQAMQQNYVPVKINADQAPALAQRFGVSGLPTDIVLAPSGQALARLRCPPTADAYAAQIVQVAAAKRTATATVTGQHDPSHTAAAGHGPANASQPGATAGRPYATATGVTPTYGTALGAAPPPVNNPYVGLGGAAAVAPPDAGNRPSESAAGPRYRPAAMERQPIAGPAAAGSFGPRGTAPNGAPASGYGPATAWPQRQSNPSAAAQASRYSAAPSPPMGQTGRTDAAPDGPARYRNTWQPSGTPAGQPAQPWRAAPGPRGAATTPQPPRGVADTRNSGTSQADLKPLGMEGYCPVTLKEKQRWIPGDRRWGVNHRGRTYLFTSAAAQRQFLADPDSFSPVLSGIDPVLAIDQGRSISGQRRHGVFFDGQVYLFSSEASLQRFSSDPKRYATGIRQAMQAAPNRIGPR